MSSAQSSMNDKRWIKNFFASKKYKNLNLVYVTVFLFIVSSLLIRIFSSDLWLNLLSEAVGTAFTVLLIDNLLNRSDRIKWKIVKDEIDYLISRNVNRLRENVLSRLFDFDPDVSENNLDADSIEKNIRQQREQKLESLYKVSAETLLASLEKWFSDKENIVYFEERASEMRQYLDMRHSEYLSPDVVHCLIDLYVNIKDLCAHLRIYNRWKLFLRKNKYYTEIATEGILFNAKNIIGILIKLKKYGYSEIAKRE